MEKRTTILVAAAGLALGAALGFLLPAGWVFVDAPPSSQDAAGDTQYACPMFCVIMEQMPEDRRCPVCGMELNPVSGASSLDAHERAMVGLEVDTIRRVPLSRSVRVVGEVGYDETRLSRITTRTAGWLERVWADTTWASVKKGDKLAAIYAPELYAAQKEYLVALAGDESLRRAAERRLKLLGIGPGEIAELRDRGEVSESLVLRSPRDGVVIEMQALGGASVKKGDLLYAIADLSRVWVQAEVFERDLVWVFEGQGARLRAEGRPGEIDGRVAFIDPVLDRNTRTARVRIEVDNPTGPDGTRLLRIGQRVDARIESRVDEEGRPVPPARAGNRPPLAVPRSAVLSTGERHVLYLLFAQGMRGRDYRIDPANLPVPVFYQMVPVRVGPVASERANGYYPLLGLDLPAEETRKLELDSLDEGLVVVTHGNLLLDSQAQLSGKPSLLFPGGSRGDDPHAEHRR